MIRILTVNQTWLHRNFHSVFVSPKNWDTPWYTQNCHLKFWNKPSSTMFNQFFWGLPYGVPCFWTVFLRLRVAQSGAAAAEWGEQPDGSLRLNMKKTKKTGNFYPSNPVISGTLPHMTCLTCCCVGWGCAAYRQWPSDTRKLYLLEFRIIYFSLFDCGIFFQQVLGMKCCYSAEFQRESVWSWLLMLLTPEYPSEHQDSP